MKIIFFSRLDLVHLYGPLSTLMDDKYEIHHIAYSDYEYNILVNHYKVKQPVLNLRSYLVNEYNSGDYEEIDVKNLDEFILKYSDNRFSLNSSIQYDRTYQYLQYSDCIKLCKLYYNIWNTILNKIKPDLFIHEPPALYMTHIASLICKSINAKYLTMIHVYGHEKYQWIFLEGDSANPLEFEYVKNNGYPENFTIEQLSFLDNFKNNSTSLMSEINNISNEIKFKKISFFIKTIRFTINTLINKNKKVLNHNSILNHIESFIDYNKKSFLTTIENLYGRIVIDFYDTPIEGDLYYYYPFHLEPEAVVLYYAEGWYKSQIKLIENIAAQLPPNNFLYVKEHPHGGHYRDYQDYRKLSLIPNIKIIKPNISGQQLIRNSKGVITINGTSGFEAIMLDKPVICFGHSFYSRLKGVIYLKHIKDLHKALNKNIMESTSKYDKKEIKYFFESSHKGFVSYFGNRQNTLKINETENIKMVEIGFEKFIKNLKKSEH
jgi:hypothetical protein